MCLRYDKQMTRDVVGRGGEITLYKVYSVSPNLWSGAPQLLSPYCNWVSGGQILRPGKVVAYTSDKVRLSKGDCFEVLGICPDRDDLLAADIDGRELDMGGLHCFVDEEPAQLLVDHLFPRGLPMCKVVKVTATADDVIACGVTQFALKSEGKTVVVKRLNISEEEFNKATEDGIRCASSTAPK